MTGFIATLKSLVGKTVGRPCARSGKEAARTRLRLEALEDRLVPSASPTVNLTTRGSEGTINEAIFAQYDAKPTGTGVINSFVRLQAANANATLEQGYNTSGRPLQYDENKSPQFTRALHLSELPTISINGKLYREFLLDINQKASQPLLSLDDLRLYTGDSGNMTGYDATTNKLARLNAVYDMNPGNDGNWVELNSLLNSGSGGGDMLLYVPDAVFHSNPANPDPNVYLYSKFGVHNAGNSGFEEWAAGKSLLTPANGSISGTLYNDLNQNGVRDAGEAGLANVTVYLDLNNDGILDSGDVFTTTDANGQYAFYGLTTGSFTSYVIRVIPQDDTWSLTSSDAIVATALLQNQPSTTNDFGLHQSTPMG